MRKYTRQLKLQDTSNVILSVIDKLMSDDVSFGIINTVENDYILTLNNEKNAAIIEYPSGYSIKINIGFDDRFPNDPFISDLVNDIIHFIVDHTDYLMNTRVYAIR